MHTPSKFTAAIFALALGSAVPAHAAMIAQTNADSISGAADYGQNAELDSSLPEFDDAPAYTLDSFSLWKGFNNYSGDNSGAVYVDVYLQGTFVGDPDFSNTGNNGGSAEPGMTYLGSSDNAVDYAAASAGSNPQDDPVVLGDKLTWTFTDIEIPVDTRFYLVISDDNTDGDLVGASFVNNGATANPNQALALTNISAADSNPLFGGSPASNKATDAEDNFYEASFTAIPEPASLVLLGVGSLLIALPRRRRA